MQCFVCCVTVNVQSYCNVNCCNVLYPCVTVVVNIMYMLCYCCSQHYVHVVLLLYIVNVMYMLCYCCSQHYIHVVLLL